MRASTPLFDATPPAEPVDRALFLVALARRVTRNPGLLERSLAAPTRRELLADARAGERRDLLRVPVEECGPEAFKRILGLQCPVVIERGCLGAPAVGWSLDDMDRRFGAFECSLRSPERATRRGHVREVLELARARRITGLYLDNVADIAARVPGFSADIGFDALAPLFPAGWAPLVTQMFLGGPATGSSFHCADNTTLFQNLQGTKHWTFVHQSQSAWMYTYPSTSGIYYHSPVQEADPRVMERYPLYARVVRFETTLHPGDVLLLPRWWWHAVRNEGDLSFGCATRFAAPVYARMSGQNLLNLVSDLVFPSQAIDEFKKVGAIHDELFRNRFYEGPLDVITVEPEARRSLPDFGRDGEAGEIDLDAVAEELSPETAAGALLCNALQCLHRLEEDSGHGSVFRDIPFSTTARHVARWTPSAAPSEARRVAADFLRR